MSGQVHPSAWDRVGYDDGRLGLTRWPLAVGDAPSEHEKECAAAYMTGYDRGKAERAQIQN